MVQAAAMPPGQFRMILKKRQASSAKLDKLQAASYSRIIKEKL